MSQIRQEVAEQRWADSQPEALFALSTTRYPRGAAVPTQTIALRLATSISFSYCIKSYSSSCTPKKAVQLRELGLQ